MSDLETNFHILLFGVRRSVRYNARRQRFFQVCHKTVMLFALLAGSATIVAFGVTFSADWPLWVKLLPAGLVSVFSAVDLIWGFSDRASQHADLVRQFTALEQQLVAAQGNPSADLISDVTDKRLAIETTEPPVLQVLDTLCHNELLRAMGYPWEEQIEVGFFQRWFASVFDISPHRLRHPTTGSAAGSH